VALFKAVGRRVGDRCIGRSGGSGAVCKIVGLKACRRLGVPHSQLGQGPCLLRVWVDIWIHSRHHWQVLVTEKRNKGDCVTWSPASIVSASTVELSSSDEIIPALGWI
jgi:hypothetical protein